MKDMRTPLRRVRGLGAAHEGTGHFWVQRLTAVSNLFLIAFFVITLVVLHDRPYEEVRAAFTHPFVAIAMALVVVSVTTHMRLGMQIVIEDYVHGHFRLPLAILNTFFAVAVAVSCLYAIVKMSFGA